MKRTIAIALCGVLLAGNSRCQKQEGAKFATPVKDSLGLSAKLTAIEKAVEAMRQAENVPGVALVIVKNDSVIFLKGFGLRNVEDNLPVTPQTLFAIDSCTKTFTALAAVISTDEGKLSLDDSPKKFLLYFKLRDPEADAQVTLRDLLSHRTGLKMDDDAGWFERHPTREGLIRFAMQSEPTARFRERFQYNNFMKCYPSTSRRKGAITGLGCSLRNGMDIGCTFITAAFPDLVRGSSSCRTKDWDWLF